MATTSNRPAARCLDLTRLISRVGRGAHTGIDRVELAYLTAILASDIPAFALVKAGRTQVLLDQGGVEALRDRLEGKVDWGNPDAVARLSRGRGSLRARALSDVRRLGVVRSGERRLGAAVRESFPAGTNYLNIGHSNLSAEVLNAFRGVDDSQVTVFLHDTIPLDFPGFQRAGSVEAFRQKVRAVANFADLVLCSSKAARNGIAYHLGEQGRVPRIEVVPLGVSVRPGEPSALPAGLDRVDPYFVVLGTIEPRKNHGFLLDLWERISQEALHAHLYVVGRRGWENREVFARLDRKPTQVTELNDLPDGAVDSLLQGARALLFPSLAEGYGLPALEAAQLGIPVLCNDLPVFQEILGDYAIYAPVSDMYSWETKIRNLMNSGGSVNSKQGNQELMVAIPSWNEHFNIVLGLT